MGLSSRHPETLTGDGARARHTSQCKSSESVENMGALLTNPPPLSLSLSHRRLCCFLGCFIAVLALPHYLTLLLQLYLTSNQPRGTSHRQTKCRLSQSLCRAALPPVRPSHICRVSVSAYRIAPFLDILTKSALIPPRCGTSFLNIHQQDPLPHFYPRMQNDDQFSWHGPLSIARCLSHCRPPIIENSPAFPPQLSPRFTHEITRHVRVGSHWDPAGREGGDRRSWRERNMCLPKEDISFGDVYRLLPTTDADGRSAAAAANTRILPEANSAQLRLDSGSCVHPNEKVGHLSSLYFTCLLRCIACTLQISHPSSFPSFFLSFFPSFSPRPFLILTWPSVRPSVRRFPTAQTRPSLGRLSAS